MANANSTVAELRGPANGSQTIKIVPGLRFHHIGLACRDIEKELRALAIVGYELEGEGFTDQLQRVHGCFLVGPGPRIELLAPSGNSSPVNSWLEKGIKMYHQAFEVPSMHDAIALLTAQRAVVLSSPKPAVAFKGRKVAFLMFPNQLLVELIESQ